MGSTAKSFAKKVPLSDAERLNETERKYGVIQERIQAYDRVLDEFKEIKKQIEDFSQQPILLNEKIAKVSDDQKIYARSLNKFIECINETWQDNVRETGSLKVTFSHHEEYVANAFKEMGDQIDGVMNKMPFYAADKANAKDLNEFKILISDQIGDMRALIKSRDTEFDDRQHEILALVDTLSDHQEKLSEHGKGIQSITVFLNKLEEKLLAKINLSSEATKANELDFQETLKKQIEAVKQEIIGTPASNAAVEARIMNRLEMATLDGSNAVTVARNNAEKIKLLEKKVEALTAQLNKYELPR